MLKNSSRVKTKEEIELMKISGKIASYALKKVIESARPNVSLKKLDKIAKKEIEKHGATSSFMTVDNYQWTICTTVNEQVVHGIPTDRLLKEGDILGIDIGALYKGFHSDMAITIAIGKVSGKKEEFLKVGEETLKEAIKKAKAGGYIGDISSVIQQMIKGAGYSIVKNLTGHGIGRELHEEPMVPGFGEPRSGPKIEENMTLAIEVIYTQGLGDVRVEKDNWTISSKDGSIGGLFEQTILVTKDKPIVLTPYL